LANLVSLKELNLTEIMLDVDFGKDLLPAQIEKLTVAVTSTSGLQKIDLSEISGLTKLRLLDASGRVIVGNPETESDLTDLILDRTVISDFAILKIFPDLKILDIGNSGLVALPDLSKAQKLTNLLANDNPISSVDGSFLPPSLRVLDLSGCSVSEIKGGSKIPYLSELSLSGNRITSLVDFSWPVGLRILNLSNNALARLADVSELVGLMDLNLSRNQIRNVSSLAILTELLQLDLSHNQVELVAPLAPLAKLTLLDVRANGLPPTTVCPLVNADICLF
jgi:internalin A